jgi:hypothetical protein
VPPEIQHSWSHAFLGFEVGRLHRGYVATHDELQSSHDLLFYPKCPTVPLFFGPQTLQGSSRGPAFDGFQALARALGRLRLVRGNQSELVIIHGVFETLVGCEFGII